MLNDAARAEAQGDLLKLVAPVDGTVQQLAVHTVGGVIQAAQPLMKIVPTKSKVEVEVEAFIENKDVGFIREGQSAVVKIDAFEYIKYGTVAARVTHVSHDAIKDEKRGLIYSVRVTLDRSTMEIDGR
ncbi:HlyD family efflux transporter periplasmic adaptor subunit [Paraburkholderia youngii]|uniref:HlyD family efflux transporter periplasmic adaptor subunit n=1 Tax=Paraburkholderia youngii TaxID=2782701 RepID=UPI003D1D53CA